MTEGIYRKKHLTSSQVIYSGICRSDSAGGVSADASGRICRRSGNILS